MIVKHKVLITAIILGMFLVTQFIGLYVIASDPVPEYLNASLSEQEQTSYGYFFFQIISAFIFAILIFVLITKYKLALFMRVWFFIVIAIALSISVYAILKNQQIDNYSLALIIGSILSLAKVLRPSVVIHNGTELLIYPGIAAIFVSILNPLYIILLLILISVYDIWAVWHSGIMQKMAKFQMEEVKIFGGFFIPYLTKQVRQKIQNAKESKNKSKLKNLKISTAILGGGDVIFPIITAGVFMLAYGSIVPAVFIIFGAFLGLLYLLIFSEKKKFYPAMPYITTGIFLGLILWKIFY